MSRISISSRDVLIASGEGLRAFDGSGAWSVSDLPVNAVVADGDALWVLAGRRDLYRVVSDAPELVARLNDGTAGCLGVHHGTVWVGGDHARLWRVDDGRFELVESFVHAPTSDDWHTPWGGPPDVFSIASDGHHLYVSVHVGGILRTTDGESWTPTIDLHDDVHQVAVGADGTVWAATGMRGLASSTDAGATWTYHAEGLHARYALAVAPVTGGALVAVSSGHSASDGAVYRFDGERCNRVYGLPDVLDGAVGPRQLSAHGDRAAAALPNGDVYTSDDAGQHWTKLTSTKGRVAEIAIAA